MSVLETLLALDKNKLEMPTKEVNITRLSELTGKPVVFTLQGIKQDEVQSIREMATKVDPNTNEVDVNYREIRQASIVAGVKEPNLRDQALLSHYGVTTPYELVNKLFTQGEADRLFEIINELTGFDDNAVQEVKN